MTDAKKGSAFDIKITVRGAVPRIPFKEIAHAVLGNRYELSLVICGDKLTRRINRQYRPSFAPHPHKATGGHGKASQGKRKNYAPNVLSFPLDKNAGEIFLNIRKAQREARQMGISAASRLAHLYAHGCFHLAGYDHGDLMEHKEDVILTRFGLIG